MDLTDIKTRLRDYIREHYEVPPTDEDFTDDVHLFDYGYVDSFGAVDLIKFTENTFGVTVGQSDLVAYPLNTINEISEFILMRLQGGASAQSVG